MSLPAESQFTDRRIASEIADPPRRPFQILQHIGPGLIIAANIVGSGELIMTTKTGAQAGIALLWLILLGCVVKVFVQLEFGRFAISHGETTLTSLNRVPGPRLFGINWIVAFWVLMISTSTAQLGGIAGGVGQSLSLTLPLTGDYAAAVNCPSTKEIQQWAAWKNTASEINPLPATPPTPKQLNVLQRIEAELQELGPRGQQIQTLALAGKPLVDDNGI
ncbi:MAG: Nramp family divalent metal transporter, partial [Planctomycetaceae bacterium]